jgi:hypothetical protein
MKAPPRAAPEPEIRHLAPGVALDAVLLDIARRERRR